jgi:hypothetical protein
MRSCSQSSSALAVSSIPMHDILVREGSLAHDGAARDINTVVPVSKNARKCRFFLGEPWRSHLYNCLLVGWLALVTPSGSIPSRKNTRTAVNQRLNTGVAGLLAISCGYGSSSCLPQLWRLPGHEVPERCCAPVAKLPKRRECWASCIGVLYFSF